MLLVDLGENFSGIMFSLSDQPSPKPSEWPGLDNDGEPIQQKRRGEEERNGCLAKCFTSRFPAAHYPAE
jgi:hypothetical protein